MTGAAVPGSDLGGGHAKIIPAAAAIALGTTAAQGMEVPRYAAALSSEFF